MLYPVTIKADSTAKEKDDRLCLLKIKNERKICPKSLVLNYAVKTIVKT